MQLLLLPITTILFGGIFNKYGDNGLYFGGDKQLISFIYTYGLIYFGIFSYLILKLTSKLESYTLVLIIASLHYGPLFFLTGQIIFSHMLVDSGYYLGDEKNKNNSCK